MFHVVRLVSCRFYIFNFYFSNGFSTKDFGSLMSFDSAKTETTPITNEQMEDQPTTISDSPKKPSWLPKSQSFRGSNRSGFVSSAKDKTVGRKSTGKYHVETFL